MLRSYTFLPLLIQMILSNTQFHTKSIGSLGVAHILTHAVYEKAYMIIVTPKIRLNML